MIEDWLKGNPLNLKATRLKMLYDEKERECTNCSTARTESTLPEQKEHCQNRNNTVPSDGHEGLIHARIQFGRSLIKFYRKLICQCLSLLKWYFLKVAKVVIM
jgi:hypothetical protein